MNELVIDDFLDQDTLDALEFYYRNNVSFGWKSNKFLEYDFGHWSKIITSHSKAFTIDTKLVPLFDSNHYYINLISDKIEGIIGKRGLYRCYYKYYTYGTDAYKHKDVVSGLDWNSDCETVILYLTKDWNPDWYGMTNLYEENDYDIYKSVMPKYNRLFVFDGKISHSATPLSRACVTNKKILVFNYMPVNKTDNAFLYIKDITENLRHGDKTLFEHLYNTYKFLDGHATLPSFVAKAGLFHSIYGTDYYCPSKNLNVSRYTIRDFIGEEAENLVYQFCTLKNREESIIKGDNMWLKMLELSNYKDQMQYLSKQENNKIDYVIKTLSKQIKEAEDV